MVIKIKHIVKVGGSWCVNLSPNNLRLMGWQLGNSLVVEVTRDFINIKKINEISEHSKKLIRHGDCWGVHLKPTVLELMGWKLGDSVDIEINEGLIIVRNLRVMTSPSEEVKVYG